MVTVDDEPDGHYGADDKQGSQANQIKLAVLQPVTVFNQLMISNSVVNYF